jgi:hypothetical protein
VEDNRRSHRPQSRRLCAAYARSLRHLRDGRKRRLEFLLFVWREFAGWAHVPSL